MDYRSRIYQRYVRAWSRSLAPESVEELSPRTPYTRKVIREHFPMDRSARILDLGCGHGAFIYFLREAGYTNVVGVDKSPEQVAEAKRLGIDGVHEADLWETLQQSADASYDVVITFDVIEHFNKEELLPLVDGVQRILRSGGRWVIHTPNGDSPFAGRIRYGDFTHEMAFTRTSISQVLLSSGFVKVVCREDKPVPHGIKSAVRWILWKMIRSGLRFYMAAETGAAESECIFSQNFLVIAVK
jgi:2-polyprenyl-3-methyl-5-hydroxy-6-metoxy-1,4-benzoquinol methylase